VSVASACFGQIGIEPKQKAPTFNQAADDFLLGRKQNTQDNYQPTKDVVFPARP
jgi:hypothetical protein